MKRFNIRHWRTSPESVEPVVLDDKPIAKVIIGIDNGYSGALACLFPNGQASFAPSAVSESDGQRVLDIAENRRRLQELLEGFTGPRSAMLAVCEQCLPNPKFGHKNNYTNGKNGEFWRMFFAWEEIDCRPVYPQQWQKHLFRHLAGVNVGTKQLAAEVVSKRLPDAFVRGYSQEQTEGINDALCIALWGREVLAGLPDPPRSTPFELLRSTPSGVSKRGTSIAKP